MKICFDGLVELHHPATTGVTESGIDRGSRVQALAENFRLITAGSDDAEEDVGGSAAFEIHLTSTDLEIPYDIVTASN